MYFRWLGLLSLVVTMFPVVLPRRNVRHRSYVLVLTMLTMLSVQRFALLMYKVFGVFVDDSKDSVCDVMPPWVGGKETAVLSFEGPNKS